MGWDEISKVLGWDENQVWDGIGWDEISKILGWDGMRFLKFWDGIGWDEIWGLGWDHLGMEKVFFALGWFGISQITSLSLRQSVTPRTLLMFGNASKRARTCPNTHQAQVCAPKGTAN